MSFKDYREKELLIEGTGSQKALVGSFKLDDKVEFECKDGNKGTGYVSFVGIFSDTFGHDDFFSICKDIPKENTNVSISAGYYGCGYLDRIVYKNNKYYDASNKEITIKKV